MTRTAPQQDNVISLDFDHTIFNTAGFYSELPVRPEPFKDTFEQVYHAHDGDIYADATTGKMQDAALRDHAELLYETGQTPDDVTTEQLVDDIQNAYNAAPEYLHEAELQELCEQYCVVIQTRQTHDGWQEHKVKISGAEPYADKVVVYDGTPAETPKDKEDAVIHVDDRVAEHEALADTAVDTFRICRSYDTDDGDAPVPVDGETLYDVRKKLHVATAHGGQDDD